MRHISLFLIIVFSFCETACDNEVIHNSTDLEFETIDKDANQINLIVTIRYRLKSRLDKELLSKFGRHYRDSFFLPAVSTVSRNILKNYSAGEIYNYKRDEIEQKLGGQAKTTFVEYEIELTDFLIRSVELPDTLKRRLEMEFTARFQNAINNCSREIKAVVTDTRPGDPIAFYEFIIENKFYKGTLDMDVIGSKVNHGDSVAIEYACEDPAFNRVKK